MDGLRLWYGTVAVQFEIVKAIRGYELMVISDSHTVRWLKVHHVDLLRKDYEWLGLLQKPASVYRSLEHYEGMPLLSWNPQERAAQAEAWNSGKRQAAVRGCDFGLDLDAKQGTWRDTIKDAVRLKALFDGHGVRYAFWMSGRHGFHFVIPYEDIPPFFHQLSNKHLIECYAAIAQKLRDDFAPSLDLSIYTPTRVLKCPYTMEKHGLVILPLDSSSFSELLLHGEEYLWPENVLKLHVIRNRGVYLQGTKEGTASFFKLVSLSVLP